MVPVNLLSMLQEEHGRIMQVIYDLSVLPEDAPHERRAKLDQLVTEIRFHRCIEDRLLRPRLDGHQDVVHSLEESLDLRYVDYLLKQIHEAADSPDGWRPALEKLRQHLDRHVEDEERDLFPAYARWLSEDELQELGEDMARMNPPAWADRRAA